VQRGPPGFRLRLGAADHPLTTLSARQGRRWPSPGERRQSSGVPGRDPLEGSSWGAFGVICVEKGTDNSTKCAQIARFGPDLRPSGRRQPGASDATLSLAARQLSGGVQAPNLSGLVLRLLQRVKTLADHHLEPPVDVVHPGWPPLPAEGVHP
jgi:hypothetical protein